MKIFEIPLQNALAFYENGFSNFFNTGPRLSAKLKYVHSSYSIIAHVAHTYPTYAITDVPKEFGVVYKAYYVQWFLDNRTFGYRNVKC